MALWEPGAQIGPYTLLDRLGSGGMGEVWKARDTRLDRTVAIKRLLSQHVSPAAAARFQQEARAIAALNHPNICQIYDVGADYLVLEFIEGTPLASKNSAPTPADDALRIALQIASALEEAHGHGITHRDLKPDNILKTRTGVKVLDFGLAKLSADSDATKTVEGTVMGTAAYMSPEQAQGKAADARSDIFSFGAVLYELLAGRRAFTGDSMAAVLGAVLHADPAPFEAPAALARVVTTCLRKAPAERFQNITEVKKALEQIAVKAEPDKPQPSIAVLPFANMSADKENEYFSDGLAEEILNLLAKIPNLKVIARISSFSFRGKEQDIRKIAETLGVSHVLEGSVRRAGNRLRVTAQLIHAADAAHLWSERYDRELNDVFAVQDEIAAAIAGALQIKLSVEPPALRSYTPKLLAYEAYLQARHHMWRTTPDDLAKSKKYFNEAIAQDPKFALAYVGYADYFLFCAGTGLKSARETMPMVQQNAQKALDLDPSLPEAHAMLGIFAAHFNHDWWEARRRFQLAMAREPVPGLVRIWYAGFYLTYVGPLEQAVEEYRRALQQDPLNALYRTNLADKLASVGRLAEAEQEVRRALEVDPHFLFAYAVAANICAARNNLPEALRFAEEAHARAPWDAASAGILAAILERCAHSGRSEEVLQKLRALDDNGVAKGMARYHACLGNMDSAVEWIEKAVQNRNPAPLFFPGFDQRALRTSPRWPALAKMMNLPA